MFCISIHVPAWGTTPIDKLMESKNQISIHVPAWGTTDCRIDRGKGKTGFQSTFPRGERLGGLCFLYAGYQFQSTFPRGERPLSPQCNPRHNPDFNPRSRVGNDTLPVNTLGMRQDFNPRSRVGNDIGRVKTFSDQFDFNPRSRVGNDGVTMTNAFSNNISIHVPAWGTT